MSLDQAVEDKFNKIAKIIAIEVSAKLSSLLNCAVTVSYSRLIDSVMLNKKIAIKKDSFLIATPISSNNLGPISIIASNQQVVTIAELASGSASNAIDNVVPNENNETAFAETVKLVINSTLARLSKFKEGLELIAGEHEARALKTTEEASLSLPNDVNDSIGIGFKINIASKLDAPLQLELNSKTITFIVEELAEIITNLDENKFTEEVKQEYLSSSGLTSSNEDSKAEEKDSGSEYQVNEKRNLGFIRDINMDLILELGRSEMLMKDVLKLTKGSAIELDRPCNQSIDLYAHNQLVARGEVVAIDDSFGLKITELVGNLNLAGDFGLQAK